MPVSGSILGSQVSKTNRTVHVQVEGMQALANKVFLLGPKAVRSLAGSLHREAQGIKAEAIEEAPVESSNLRNSIYAPLPKIAAGTIEQIVGAGGVAEAYALPVHEIPAPPDKSVGGRSAIHEPHLVGTKMVGHGGKWKWLEDPFDRASVGMLERVGADVQADLGL